MKGKSILKVVLLTIVIMTVCTWIFPCTSFTTALAEAERSQLGLFDLFTYPTIALQYFGYVVIYSIAIAVFYGVCSKINAYKATIDTIKNKFAGKEEIFLVSVIVLLATLVSVTGFSFGMLLVFPFIASIIIAMGYNKLVAASVTVGSVVAGLAGTTLGTQSTSYLNSLLSLNDKGDMITKVVVLLVFVIILAVNIVLYARKTKSNVVEKIVASKKEVKVEEVVEVKEEKKSTKTTKKKSTATKSTAKKSTAKKTTKKTKAAMAMNNEAIKVEKKQSIIPFVIVFDLTLLIAMISVFDWNGLFKIDLFKNVADSVFKFKIGDFPIVSKLLGNITEWGTWSIAYEIPALVIVGAIILALCYRVKMDDVFDGIADSLKKAIVPIICMILTFVVLIIVTYSPIQLTIMKAIIELTKGFNVVTVAFVSMLASVFNVEASYTASSVLPYLTSIVTDTKLYPLIQIIFQSIYGLMMLVAPTSVILVGTLSYLDIPYTQWLKHIWKVFVEVLVALLIIFVILLATV